MKMILIAAAAFAAIALAGCGPQIAGFSEALQCASAESSHNVALQSPPPATCERLRREGLLN